LSSHTTYTLDPFEDTIDIYRETQGNHKTLGIIITNNKEIDNWPQLLDCHKSMPATRIPKWRSILRNSFPTSINGTKISSTQDIIRLVKDARGQKNNSIKCTFAIISKIAMHPWMRIPILYHDQLNVIATHVVEIKENIDEQGETHRQYLHAILPSVTKMKSMKKS